MTSKRSPAPLKAFACALLALSLAGPAWADSTKNFSSSQKMEFAANMPNAKPQDIKAQKTVVVKLAKTTSGAARLGRGNSDADKQWKELAAEFPGATFEPYFSSTSEQSLRALSRGKAGGEDFGGDDIRLWSYVRINVPEGTDPAEVVKLVSGWSSVEFRLCGSRSQRRHRSSRRATIRSAIDQGYLNAAPEGIDAHWAWEKTTGADVLFVDVEQGWTLNHQDLKRAQISLISGENAVLSRARHRRARRGRRRRQQDRRCRHRAQCQGARRLAASAHLATIQRTRS